MSNANKRVSYLFNLYYTKQATDKELRELFERLDAYNEDQLTDLMREAWEDLHSREDLFDEAKSQSILKSILKEGKPGNVVNLKSKGYWRLGIAATILISLGVAAYFLTQPKPITEIAKVQLPHDALPGSNKAILTLSNGETLVLDSTHKGLIAQQGNARVIKNKDGQVDYKVADDASNAAAIAYNTITTPKGYQYHVVLPDGSKVWLNAASSIKFPTQFTGAQRNVEMTGEAYFEVAKNPAMPFIVKTNRQEVRVLGTHFSIMAYDDESVSRTTLLEGSIMLTGQKSSHILKPGNQAVLNAQGDVNIIEDADTDEAIAWKNGLFQFKDEGIEGIMRQAARWYDVNVTYKGKIPTRQFKGKIPRNVKLSEMLSMFKYAGVNFNIEGRELTVTN
ncbi:MAG: FecR domain-containing protein [Bacteroidota bacterium]